MHSKWKEIWNKLYLKLLSNLYINFHSFQLILFTLSLSRNNYSHVLLLVLCHFLKRKNLISIHIPMLHQRYWCCNVLVITEWYVIIESNPPGCSEINVSHSRYWDRGCIVGCSCHVTPTFKITCLHVYVPPGGILAAARRMLKGRRLNSGAWRFPWIIEPRNLSRGMQPVASFPECWGSPER